MARRSTKKQPAPERMGALSLALGIGTFLLGTAALAAGAMALAVRRQDDGPEEERADPVGHGRPLVASADEQAAAAVPSDGAATSPGTQAVAAQVLGSDAPDAGGPAPAQEQVRGAGEATPGEGHAAPDLAPGAPVDAPVPVAFRPDIDAPMSDAEREALRPPVGHPTLIDAGTSLTQGS